jgi:hypothetical protein
MVTQVVVSLLAVQMAVLIGPTGRQLDRLSEQEVVQAIQFGLDHPIGPYELRANGYVAALLYTPFVRIAMAAHTGRTRGVTFGSADVPDAWRERVVYVAMRWFPHDPGESGGVEADTQDVSVTLVPSGYLPGYVDRVDPIWLSHDPALLAPFGVTVPYPDVVAIAAFPMAALRADHDVIAFRRTVTDTGQRGGHYRLARIAASDISALR